MKQSMALLQRPVAMPRYSETFPDARGYIFSLKEGQDSPRSNQRALRAFVKHSEAHEWAKNNLDRYIVASNYQTNETDNP